MSQSGELCPGDSVPCVSPSMCLSSVRWAIILWVAPLVSECEIAAELRCYWAPWTCDVFLDDTFWMRAWGQIKKGNYATFSFSTTQDSLAFRRICSRVNAFPNVYIVGWFRTLTFWCLHVPVPSRRRHLLPTTHITLKRLKTTPPPPLCDSVPCLVLVLSFPHCCSLNDLLLY